MKKYILLPLACSSLLFSCGNESDGNANSATTTQTSNDEDSDQTTTAPNTETTAQKERPRGTIYRCDGFRPGTASEWVQVAYADKENKIVGIWLWDSNNEKKVQVKILEQRFAEGEISGFAGTFEYPGGDKYGFGIVEDRFNISTDDQFQEFEYEGHED